METIENKEMINFNIDADKLKEKHWIRLLVVVFAITPFIFSFIFLSPIPAFSEYSSLFSITALSLLLQIPILIIGMPLYYLSNKISKPEKKSATEYEFDIRAYRSIHFFMSSFFMSGFYGVIALILCIIFKLNQVYFVLGVYGYLLARLIIMLPVWIVRKNC